VALMAQLVHLVSLATLVNQATLAPTVQLELPAIAVILVFRARNIHSSVNGIAVLAMSQMIALHAREMAM